MKHKPPVTTLLLVLGVALSLYALALTLSGDVPLDALSHALTTHTGVTVLLLCLSNYALRGWRWRTWMHHLGHPLPALTALRIYLCGYAFTATPGNVGEAARGMLLKPRLSAQSSVSIFGAERVADLLGLLLLCVPAVVWMLGTLGLEWWVSVLGLLVLVVLAWRLYALWRSKKEEPASSSARAKQEATSLLQHVHPHHHEAPPLVLTPRAAEEPTPPPTLLQKAQQALAQAWGCLRHQPLQWLSLTVLAWLAQGMAVWLICTQQGLNLHGLLATGIYALSMVGGAVSMLPAGLGGTEAIMTGLLMWVAQDSAQTLSLAQAVVITLVVRLLTLWLAVALGLLTLLYSAWRRPW